MAGVGVEERMGGFRRKTPDGEGGCCNSNCGGVRNLTKGTVTSCQALSVRGITSFLTSFLSPSFSWPSCTLNSYLARTRLLPARTSSSATATPSRSPAKTSSTQTACCAWPPTRMTTTAGTTTRTATTTATTTSTTTNRRRRSLRCVSACTRTPASAGGVGRLRHLLSQHLRVWVHPDPQDTLGRCPGHG